MNHPPYHLRPNKAVDRFLFIELLSIISNMISPGISGYTYHSLGGPFLDDFRVLHQNFPNIKMVCIEQDENTHKRQKFNKPHRKIKFINKTFSDFFAEYELTGKDIFWLDYTNLKLSNFTEFQSVLEKIEEYGIIKITLNVNTENIVRSSSADKRSKFIEKFKEDFSEVIPADLDDESDFRQANFPYLIQRMLQVSIQNILTDPTKLIFQPLTSFYYKDGQPVLTLTGIVLDKNNHTSLKQKIAELGWKYFNLDWGEPTKINVPTLSVKERLALDPALPCATDSVFQLKRKLSFELGESELESVTHLRQYADFYRFYPYFSKVTI